MREPFSLSLSEEVIPRKSQTTKSLGHFESFIVHDRKINFRLDKHVVGAGAVTQFPALVRPMANSPGSKSNLNAEPASYAAPDRYCINAMGANHENSLFSSSFSELFSRRMMLSSHNAPYGHSIGTIASHYEEEEPFVSSDEVEAQTIGNLLPDDDELLSGVTDGLDFVPQPSSEDVEELDFFSNVGGMDLEDEATSVGQKYLEYPGGISHVQSGSNGLVAGEHPHGEYPSRTLFVRNISSNVEDSELQSIFKSYGDIRTLYTACKHRGFVIISYYDIRAAHKAMQALQGKPLRRRKLDIHYSVPKENPSEEDVNQGTVVVSNLDSSVSHEELCHIFGSYGEINEIREAQHGGHNKYIEFCDIRAAEAALRALNKREISGKRITVETSGPGEMKGLVQPPLKVEHNEYDLFLQQNTPQNHSTATISGPIPVRALISNGMGNGTVFGLHPVMRGPLLESTFHHGISSSVPSSLPSLMGGGSVGKQSIQSQGQLNLDMRASPNIHPHSLPDSQDGYSAAHLVPPNAVGTSVNSRPPEAIDSWQLCRVGSNGQSLDSNQGVFGSAGNGSSPVPGHHYTWGNSYRPQPPGMVWPNSPSFANGMCAPHPVPRLHGFSRGPSQLLNAGIPRNIHHVGSAPAVNLTIWERQQAYAGESPEASSFHPGSLGTARISDNSLTSMEFVPNNVFPPSGNCMDLPIPPKIIGFQSPQQRCMIFPGRNQMMPVLNSFDFPNERVRSRRNEAASNQADNKRQFELDIDRIIRGEDSRTTLMIKNIPNKYTSKMLLAAIDERHRGTYDFLYLPIDFKNKCNVGYAFINMTEPGQIVTFYKAFNGKKWEKFNSEKVASLAYARIQGKAALIAHFQNSSLMNEDKRCRPILFNTEGPNAGDQVPFPVGSNVRTRPGRARSSTLDENHQGSPPTLANGVDFGIGDSSISSGKDSD
ncbi:protein MEI2-like 4 isoform X2 [Rhodamnia argentea]|nr:protein MEI2-like 4 isoform X2 [Rhodamnia argentea]XP_048137527.1 protein MEI2-like 4 isoform X2 [Rhodamnia argentea]